MGFADQKFRDLLAQLASKTPTPGGGAVAGAVGALAGALGRMALEYSHGPKIQDADREKVKNAIAELTRLGEKMLELGDSDAEAYATLNRLQKLDASDPERIAGWAAAVDGAIDVPRSVMQAGGAILEQLEGMSGLCNRWLRSDLAIAALLAEAAVRAAAWNVEVNLPLLEGGEARQALEKETARSLAQAEALSRHINKACRN